MLTERIYYANQPSKIMVLKVKDGIRRYKTVNHNLSKNSD